MNQTKMTKLRLAACLGLIFLLEGFASPVTVLLAPVEDRDPFINEVTATSAKIVWHTADPSATRIGYGTDPENPDGWKWIESFAPERRHSVTLTGLAPDTVYYYGAGEGDGGGEDFGGSAARYIGPEYRFRTPPADGSSPFSFFAVGDTGGGGPNQFAVANRIDLSDCDFGIHTGDVIYPYGRPTDFQTRYFIPYAGFLRNTPFFTCPGNHDYMIDPTYGYSHFYTAGDDQSLGGYLDQFHLFRNNADQTEEFYSFDYGNAHFACINSSMPVEDRPRQLQFLAADLAASSKKWKFAYFHHPPYTSGRDGEGGHYPSAWLRLPEFFDNKVDIVFSGHNHWYERTHPIRNDGPNPLPTDDYDNSDPNAHIGTIYIVTGGGGVSSYGFPPGDPPQEIKTRRAGYHFVRVDIAGDRLTLRGILPNGEPKDPPFDTMTISKASGVKAR